MADAGSSGLAAVALGQTTFAYSFFLPPLREVRKSAPDNPDVRGDVLLGQVAAGALSLSVGALLSWMTSSPYPVYATLFIAVVIAAVYQYALGQGESA